MIPSNEGSLVILPPGEVSSAVKSMYFNRAGFDQANIYVNIGKNTATVMPIKGIEIVSGDALTSAATDMAAIAALSCSETTSTAALNALPAIATQKKGGIITEFQIDLRKRKKYIGVVVTPSTVATEVTGMGVGIIARLTRSGESKDSAAQKSLPFNLTDTNIQGCMQIVAG